MSSNKLIFLIVLSIGCLAQMASDIYTPSLSAIALQLQTPINLVQFSMAIYMFGMASSIPIYGTISEGFGRRTPLLAGLIIMLFGSMICVTAPNIQILILGRLTQGLGAGACSVLWRSIFRDVFQGVDLAKYGSYLVIFITFIIPATPTLGGYLQQYFDWRASFVFLIFVILTVIALTYFYFKETSQHHHLERLKFSFIQNGYKKIITNRIFMGNTICTFLCYGAFFSWFAVGPVLLIHDLGISPVQFGWITFFASGISTALGGYINGKYVSRFGMQNMFRFGLLIIFISGIIMLLLKLFIGMNLFSIIAPIVLFYFGVTFIWPNAYASAFAPFGKISGYASALYCCVQISGAAIIGAIVAHLPHENQTPLAIVLILTATIAWLIFEKMAKD